jgi:hypothetical protein
MSITRLHNTDKLQHLVELQQKRGASAENHARMIDEAKTLAWASDKRSQESATLLADITRRIDEIEAKTKYFDSRSAVFDEHLEAIELSLKALEERQAAFDEACRIISEDHAKIDDLLANLHTGLTPRLVPSIDVAKLDPPTRTMEPDALGRTEAVADLGDIAKQRRTPAVTSTVKARIVSGRT